MVSSQNGVLISVVICTYNRAELLTGAIQSLCHQTLDCSLYEIIVVDNNSTDDTHAVVELFAHYGNVRYCLETRQGLSHARNRGWQVAQGEYVAYIDDDCKVPAHWLAVAKEVIELVSPAAFGGPYFAYYSTPKPPWFQDRYASHVQGEKARPLGQHEYLSGMNIAFRKSLFQHLGGFDPNLGMSGQKIAYGEETDILRRIRATMPNEVIYYEPRLFVHHLVRPEKMTMRWIMRQRFADGRYSYRVFQGDSPLAVGPLQVLRQIVRTLLAFGVDVARGVLQRDLTRYPYVQNYLYEHTFRCLQALGGLYEQYRQIMQQSEVERREGMTI